MRGLLVVVFVTAVLWFVVSIFFKKPVEGATKEGAAREVQELEAELPQEAERSKEPDVRHESAQVPPEDVGSDPNQVLPEVAGEPESVAFQPAERPKDVPPPRDVPMGDVLPYTDVDPTPLGVVEDDDEPFEVQLDVGDPTELGRLLLHHPERLQGFLNEGEGKQLPVATKKLVTAFALAGNGNFRAAEKAAEGLEGADGITSRQEALLRDAFADRRPRARSAGASRHDPLARAMHQVLLERSAENAFRGAEYADAAREYSELLLGELGAPWADERPTILRWVAALNDAQAHHRFDPKGEWASIDYVVKSGQSLVLIRKDVLRSRPDLLLCTGLIHHTNRLGKYIQADQVLRIPTDRASILVDVSARVALYLHGSEVVQAWEIGVGKEGQETPVGQYVVGEKQENPSWMPVGKPPRPYGDPKNPLGTRWIGWHQDNAKTSFGFHGTSDPDGVGGKVSQGCVRMRNEHVELLFELLPVGASIVVQL